MQQNQLQSISTRQLVEELQKRQGVNRRMISPYEKYKIILDDSIIEDIGPAVLLVVID